MHSESGFIVYISCKGERLLTAAVCPLLNEPCIELGLGILQQVLG